MLHSAVIPSIESTQRNATVNSYANITNVTLLSGSNYTIDVRTKNSAGLYSDISSANGIVVDYTNATFINLTSTYSTGYTNESSPTFSFNWADNVSNMLIFMVFL